MRRTRIAMLVLTAGACGGAALGGCGSGGTKTVTAAGAPPETPSSSTGASTTEKTSTTPAPSSGSSSAGGTGTTRTAPEPAFTQHESAGAQASAAAALVRAHGYTPNDSSQYRPDQTLRVLVGTRTGSGDGYGQQAFFFVDGRYIGTDAKEPSATLKVVSQSDTSVTLAYPLYRRNDPLCCPGAGQATVRFELDNGRLTPAQAIPPLRSSSTAPGRY